MTLQRYVSRKITHAARTTNMNDLIAQNTTKLANYIKLDKRLQVMRAIQMKADVTIVRKEMFIITSKNLTKFGRQLVTSKNCTLFLLKSVYSN